MPWSHETKGRTTDEVCEELHQLYTKVTQSVHKVTQVFNMFIYFMNIDESAIVIWFYKPASFFCIESTKLTINVTPSKQKIRFDTEGFSFFS